MTKLGAVAVLSLIAVAAAAAPAVAMAQSNDEINAGIEFNFTPPGARSMALGGAFLALADDATAAATNPAGLTGLGKFEVSFEGLSQRFTHRFSDTGHAFGEPTGIGFDTAAGIRFGESTNSVFGLSYLAFVYPGSDSWAISLYRHELSNFEASFERFGTYFDSLFRDFTLPRQIFAARANIKLNIVNFGASGAYQVSDSFSIGAGFSIYNFAIDSITERYTTRPGRDGLTLPPDLSASNLANLQTQSGTDQSAGFSIGFLWRINPRWQIAGVARPGPKFDYVARDYAGVTSQNEPAGTFRDVPAHFKVPDQYGIGLAYRPRRTLSVTIDYDRVQYSQMTDGLAKVLDDRSDKVITEDANEVHAGVEYIVGRQTPISLRLGAWYSPDHQFRFAGSPEREVEQREAIVFAGGEDRVHATGGLGFIFADRYVLDVAVDYSSQLTSATAYFTVQFGPDVSGR